MKKPKNKPKTSAAKKPSKKLSQASGSARAAEPSAAPSAPVAPASESPTAAALVAAASMAVVVFSAEVLRHALGFVLVACPKEGPFSTVIFDADDNGTPLVAARDAARCHTAFLPMGATCLARGQVARNNVRKLHRLLGGLDPDDNDVVVITSSGRVEIRRNSQPSLHHTLDFESLDPGEWQPPPDFGAMATHAPLVLASDKLQRAVRFPEAIVRIEQRTSARMIVNVERGGEVVARAVLAEAEQRLYPEEEPKQTTFTFERAGRASLMGAALDRIAPPSVAKAARELRERLQPRSTEPTRVELAAFPEPGAEGFTVVEIPEALWDELSPETLAELHLPPGVETRIAWFSGGDRAKSSSLTAPVARAVGAELAKLSLRCDVAELGRRHGLEVTVWTVGRAGEKGAAV
jgi:hypothetical protein